MKEEAMFDRVFLSLFLDCVLLIWNMYIHTIYDLKLSQFDI